MSVLGYEDEEAGDLQLCIDGHPERKHTGDQELFGIHATSVAHLDLTNAFSYFRAQNCTKGTN
jgi:hypothetical protein